MAELTIHASVSLCALIVDSGRRGYAHEGVNQGGACDLPSFHLANLALNQDKNLAAIELSIGRTELSLSESRYMVVTGTGFSIMYKGKRYWSGWPVFVEQGQQVFVESSQSGMRGYLQVQGGIDVPRVLGSKAAHIQSGFGGYQGRFLKQQDTLPLGHVVTATPKALRQPTWRPVVRFVPANHYFRLTEDAKRALFANSWQVSSQTDRMGTRLVGNKIHYAHSDAVPSHGVFPGVIQLPPDGQPIILLADCGLTGGYPTLGTVIEADLWLIAQARPKEHIQLVPIALEKAVVLNQSLQRDYQRAMLAR